MWMSKPDLSTRFVDTTAYFFSSPPSFVFYYSSQMLRLTWRSLISYRFHHQHRRSYRKGLLRYKTQHAWKTRRCILIRPNIVALIVIRASKMGQLNRYEKIRRLFRGLALVFRQLNSIESHSVMTERRGNFFARINFAQIKRNEHKWW